MDTRLHNCQEVREYLEKEHPSWLRALTPRHINAPAEYWSQKVLALSSVNAAMQNYVNIHEHQTRHNPALAAVHGQAALLLRYDVPTYYVSRELLAAALRTELPDDMVFEAIPFPFDAWFLWGHLTIKGVFSTLYFAGDDVAEVFCADNTFDIKDMDRGMILLLPMPQKLQTERRYVCTLLKLLFYQHVSDRFDLKTDSDAWINKNVLILWQDEAQSFASEADKVVDKIREAYGTTVMATQSLLSLFPPLGGKEKAEVVLLNLRNRVVFQVADEESAKITADFIGKQEVTRKDRSVSVSSRQHTTYNYRKEEQHKIKPGMPGWKCTWCTSWIVLYP